ncbi:methyltransferase type 12 [Actinomadura rubrobrunea]|uniref:Methyltransferase type 12 n=1 Tax=Actinomadura rubrobrunea TaxID=115335 RepID=A0A9W6UUI4_9ACTN|nr:class I SAM-dependent methyltransferase [Actinomadura rubrobrunea]GLW63949.1 methyltransferase type 12 [Actinomadura rubrobrunea]
MLAETLVRAGHLLIGDHAPEGRDYWARRFWDRDEVESRPVLGDDFRAQKKKIAEYIETYGGDAARVIEIACGTGEFTAMAARSTAAKEIVAVDISEQALRIAGERVEHPGLTLRQGDFWAVDDLGTAPLVLCVDAVHHLGRVRKVLERLKTFVEPGGVFIGNLWTIDNYHDYQRTRYGALQHLGRSALFLANAVAMRATGGRVRWASYRTQLLPAKAVEPMLREVFDEVLGVHTTRFFVAFACRRSAGSS